METTHTQSLKQAQGGESIEGCPEVKISRLPPQPCGQCHLRLRVPSLLQQPWVRPLLLPPCQQEDPPCQRPWQGRRHPCRCRGRRSGSWRGSWTCCATGCGWQTCTPRLRSTAGAIRLSCFNVRASQSTGLSSHDAPAQLVISNIQRQDDHV